ncbi:MAG: hypothetical protein L0312_22045, partial [Acidobacteria bacterium]|nr:hypothetical protein [Acidobacteriota bacterium]
MALVLFIWIIVYGLALANLWGVAWLLKRLSLSPRWKKLFFVFASTVVLSPMPTQFIMPNGVLLLQIVSIEPRFVAYWKFAFPSFLLTALASAFLAQKILKGPEQTVFAFDGLGRVDPDARPHFLMRGFPILLTVLIALIAIGIGPDLWRSWSPRWAKGEAALHYQAEYQQWLAADLDVLLREMVALRGEAFSTRPPSTVLRAEALLPDTVEPTLATLLNQPQRMAALDLERPRNLLPNVDIRALIGDRRCPHSYSQLHAESIEPGSVPSRSNRAPRVACQSLLNAVVLREGTQYGDWLFLLPDSQECPWLYLSMSSSSDAYCAASLKSWLAASVVGAKSLRPRLLWGEPELVKELHAQPRMGLKEGIAELCAAG